MSSFNFRLQNVLDYRNSLLDRQRAELAAIQVRLTAAEEILQALRASETATLACLEDLQKNRLDMPQVLQLMDRLGLLASQIAQQTAHAQMLRAQFEAAQEKLWEMLKDVRALEKLRERQLEAYRREGQRLERRETSEIAALRHRAALGGAAG